VSTMAVTLAWLHASAYEDRPELWIHLICTAISRLPSPEPAHQIRQVQGEKVLFFLITGSRVQGPGLGTTGAIDALVREALSRLGPQPPAPKQALRK
jgi:hypothetical protein